MAKIKGPLFSVGASGGYGGVLCFRDTPHGAVVTRRHYPGSVSDVVPSQSQLDVRANYGAAVAGWRALSSAEQALFNARASLLGLSGWNLYLREFEVTVSGSFGPVQVVVNERDGTESDKVAWKVSGHDSDGDQIGSNLYDSAFAWEDVLVPNGVSIDDAYLDVFLKWRSGALDLDLVIRGFAVDDLPVFSQNFRPSQIPKTSSFVLVDFGLADYADETWYRFGGLEQIISEIVGRPGWVEGNSIGLVIEDRLEATVGRIQVQDSSRQPQFAAQFGASWS